MPADFLERDFASAFDEIRSRFPKARLSVRTDLSARLAEDVGHGRLDLAFYKRAPSNAANAAITPVDGNRSSSAKRAASPRWSAPSRPASAMRLCPSGWASANRCDTRAI
jgi:DNA-binding transcriptional LysR family regulator